MQFLIKKLVFAGLMLIMLLPVLQQQTNFISVDPLKGSFEETVCPQLSFQTYLSGDFQDVMNKYIEQHIGFRPWLVRVYNQFRFSLFGQTNAKSVVVGKKGYLFEQSYIDALFGLDYVGDEKLHNDIEKTIAIAEWLDDHNKHLFIVLAPGKANFFPDYVPNSRYKRAKLRNTDEYYTLLNDAKIPAIHCNPWFLSIKDTISFPLYPKSGIHWSFYGLGLVMDSVFKMINTYTPFRLPDFHLENLVLSDSLLAPDQDIWEGMNLICFPNDYPMCYPDFIYDKKPSDSLPRVATIADSYYWQWFGLANVLRSFKSNEFWYYNAQLIEAGTGIQRDRKDVDLLLEIVQTDIFVILQTDANMDRFSFGFIDDAYRLLIETPADTLKRMLEIRNIAQRIQLSPSYMELIHEKAVARDVSDLDMLLLDAAWLYEREKN